MSDPAATPAAAPATAEATFPEGWQLGAESWSFHRQFHARVGRPTTQGEYSAILAQIRWHIAPRIDRYRYRVTLPDGTPLIVSGNWHRLHGVEPTGWTPPPAKAPALAPPTTQPQARSPPIAEPPPRQPLRASTLTLGNPLAARVLAERLRRAGIQAAVHHHEDRSL